MTRVKKEVIEISDDESTNQTIELGRIMNYNQLREIFMDRSPLHSDTETESESDHVDPSETGSERGKPGSLKGATGTSDTQNSLTSIVNDLEENPEKIIESDDGNKQDSTKDTVLVGDTALIGATGEISQEDLLKLQQELELSDDNETTVTESGINLVKCATCPKGCTQDKTLEDAIWKESTNEFSDC